MIYKCEKCDLIGDGMPQTSKCPNCGHELILKMSKGDSDILSEGVYKTVEELLDIFKHSLFYSEGERKREYAPEWIPFLNKFGAGINYQIEVNSELAYLEIKGGNYERVVER